MIELHSNAHQLEAAASEQEPKGRDEMSSLQSWRPNHPAVSMSEGNLCMGWQLQVAVLKRLRSENIVRFLGVCFQDSQTMLVTELMSNGSLHNSIRDSHSNASGDKDGDVSWYNK